MTTVMLVANDMLLLRRWCRLLVDEGGFGLFAAVGHLAAARQAIQRNAPDVLVTDLGLPDGCGTELIRETAARHPATDILVLMPSGDEWPVLAAIEAGATGCVRKDSLADAIVGSIHQLRASGSAISPVVARQVLRRFGLGSVGLPRRLPVPPETSLSPRESEVLTLITKGFSYGEVARLLALSPHTITAHVKKVYRKLAVHSRGEAAYEGSRMGLA